MLGFSPAPTVRGLFGPNAKFITSLRGTPAAVTLENATGTAGEFTGQLLLTLKDPETGDMKAIRLLVTFESDNTAEMSYCRYVKLVSLIDGSITERRSDGSQDSDANILGILAGVMEAFWDTSEKSPRRTRKTVLGRFPVNLTEARVTRSGRFFENLAFLLKKR
jgi:hypothetical protein